MMRYVFVPLSAILLASCGSQPAAVAEADAPTATVVLRDGTKIQGQNGRKLT